ncbi:hypothetical protein EPA93_24975 [Ktedonosporobacter rubrisoli]|uniref:Uncharacterized protein n=1 Tax=Ktedonosporobacter rubrisoli TaxID=2509675 RepID=A0A4P6JUS6_KTERU|nr:hypothetical protein [Ktedonosporobacter rubrisoli]QBD79062.1 hypothetical protein EPA93_24975 [Ktedonosporobacter rubrisoli]
MHTTARMIGGLFRELKRRTLRQPERETALDVRTVMPYSMLDQSAVLGAEQAANGNAREA